MTLNFFFLFLIFFGNIAFSDVKIDITQGNIDPIPYALLDFDSKSKELSDQSKEINKVIKII